MLQGQVKSVKWPLLSIGTGSKMKWTLRRFCAVEGVQTLLSSSSSSSGTRGTQFAKADLGECRHCLAAAAAAAAAAEDVLNLPNQTCPSLTGDLFNLHVEHTRVWTYCSAVCLSGKLFNNLLPQGTVTLPN